MIQLFWRTSLSLSNDNGHDVLLGVTCHSRDGYPAKQHLNSPNKSNYPRKLYNIILNKIGQNFGPKYLVIRP